MVNRPAADVVMPAARCPCVRSVPCVRAAKPVPLTRRDPPASTVARSVGAAAGLDVAQAEVGAASSVTVKAARVSRDVPARRERGAMGGAFFLREQFAMKASVAWRDGLN